MLSTCKNAFFRCCCPCCLRGEPEEKTRVKVSYGSSGSPKQEPEETRALLKPEEKHDDAINENGDTVKEKEEQPSHQNQNDNEVGKEHNKENADKDDAEITNGGVNKDTNADGEKGERVAMKTVTTAATKTTKAGDESSKNLTRDMLEKTQNKSNSNEDEETEIVEFVDKNGRRVRRKIVKKVVTTTISTKKGSNKDSSKPETVTGGDNDGDKYSSVYKSTVVTKTTGGGEKGSVVERFTTSSDDKDPIMVVKRDRQINMPDWMEEGKSPGTKSQDNDGDKYSSVYKSTVVTKTTGGGENGSVVERFTTSSDDKDPIMVVKRDRQINMPDWMEEGKSPGTKSQDVSNSNIRIFLKYPGNDAKDKRKQDEIANESKILPEVAKQDKPDIFLLDLENVVKEIEKEKSEVKKMDQEVKPVAPEPTSGSDDEDESEDEDEEGEYDEFEEELVIIEVNRKYRYPKGLEVPKSEPEKVGIPIEDLLNVPTMQLEQESAPDEKLVIEEKIVPVEFDIEYTPTTRLDFD
ncbi:protein starmaker-like isoform X2 [Montipora foliosa]|uniref:protein starmaker-like isoform X2 n=1 Tax=Montipora foliosa TaxID=591990 RepID=UPI0035F12FB1